MNAQRLKGEIALITGSDSGIGQATAVAFAKEGADVAVPRHVGCCEPQELFHYEVTEWQTT